MEKQAIVVTGQWWTMGWIWGAGSRYAQWAYLLARIHRPPAPTRTATPIVFMPL